MLVSDCYNSTASSARALTKSFWSSCVGSTCTLGHHDRPKDKELVEPDSWSSMRLYILTLLQTPPIYMCRLCDIRTDPSTVLGTREYLRLYTRGATSGVVCYNSIRPLPAHRSHPRCYLCSFTQHTLQDTTILHGVDPELWHSVLLDIFGVFRPLRVPFCGLRASSADDRHLAK